MHHVRIASLTSIVSVKCASNDDMDDLTCLLSLHERHCGGVTVAVAAAVTSDTRICTCQPATCSLLDTGMPALATSFYGKQLDEP